MHEALQLMNFSLTKAQVKSMNINCYDLYYTFIEILSEQGGDN